MHGLLALHIHGICRGLEHVASAGHSEILVAASAFPAGMPIDPCHMLEGHATGWSLSPCGQTTSLLTNSCHRGGGGHADGSSAGQPEWQQNQWKVNSGHPPLSERTAR